LFIFYLHAFHLRLCAVHFCSVGILPRRSFQRITGVGYAKKGHDHSRGNWHKLMNSLWRRKSWPGEVHHGTLSVLEGAQKKRSELRTLDALRSVRRRLWSCLVLKSTAGQQHSRRCSYFAGLGLAKPITPQAIRAPALPTGWPPSSTLAWTMTPLPIIGFFCPETEMLFTVIS